MVGRMFGTCRLSSYRDDGCINRQSMHVRANSVVCLTVMRPTIGSGAVFVVEVLITGHNSLMVVVSQESRLGLALFPRFWIL